MKVNYKNWVPKILIVGMAAATLLSLTLLLVFGVCGVWVTKAWQLALGILFAIATIACGKTLQWSITAYNAFSYDGKRQLSRQIIEGTAKYVNLPEGGIGLDVGCGSFAIHDLMSKNRYGDMEAFCRKLREMGYADVQLIDTTDGMFMSKKESKRLMLQGSTLLVGRK